MNLFNRITATFTSKVDSIVSRVENHDAVVEVALNDTRAALAKARVRLARIRKDGDGLRQKCEELRQMENTWAERAKAIATEDEKKALACINRRNLCREQAAQTWQALSRHQELEEQISASVGRMEQRLAELVQQRNLLRSRHSTAEAQRVLHQIEGGSAHGIEDTFDRWEALITETEYAIGSYGPQVDSLDADFARQENDEKLKADLAALLASHTPADSTPANCNTDKE